MATLVKAPYSFFTATDGTALEGGKIYIGEVGLDPEANPIVAYWDEALTITASQPIRTVAGLPDRTGSPAEIFVGVDYSITVRDANDVLVYTLLDAGSTLDTADSLSGAFDTIASASTTDLSTVSSVNVIIEGVATITALGTVSEGAKRYVEFAGVLILTHNATSLMLPSGANITTAVGDKCLFTSKGSGNWICDYFPINGEAIVTDITKDLVPVLGGPLDTNSKTVFESKGADLDSATPLILGTDGNNFDVTGSVTISSINTWGTASGVANLTFLGAPTVEHHATDLILPGGADLDLSAGDVLTLHEYDTGKYRCIGYIFADGTAVNGGLFTGEFSTSGQTITSAAQLVLPHSLGVEPELFSAKLTCTSADSGFSIGEIIPIPIAGGVSSRGVGVKVDATNITVRFGNATAVFDYLNDDTGVAATLNNARWTFGLKAWA